MNARPMVNFFTALKNGFANYVNFKGRIRRSEYWFFMLVINFFTFLLTLLTFLYAAGIITTTRYYRTYPSYSYDGNYNGTSYDDIKKDMMVLDNQVGLTVLIILSIIYFLCIVLPVLSATARRLHDVGKNGEYMFIAFVPFFGGLSLLVLLCLDSKQNKNKYGPSPKYVVSEIDKNLDYEEANSLTDQMIGDNNFETPINLNTIN